MGLYLYYQMLSVVGESEVSLWWLAHNAQSGTLAWLSDNQRLVSRMPHCIAEGKCNNVNGSTFKSSSDTSNNKIYPTERV